MTVGHRVAMLGTGLIGDFYTMTLHGRRGRRPGRGRVLALRRAGPAFRRRWDVPHATTSIEDAVTNPDVDTVVVGLPNHMHEEAIAVAAAAGKPVLCTKPLARSAEEAQRILDVVESAGVFAGYLEDLVYTPKTIKSLAAVASGAIGDVMWVRSRETHPGPHSAWFWDAEQAGGGCIVDLGCHCIEIIRSYVGKTNRPVDVMCWSDTLVHPIEAEDNAIALVRFESGADRAVRGQLDVPRRDGPARRGGRHRGHDLDQPLPAHRVRDVLERRGRLRRREGRDGERMAVPRRRRGRRARLRRDVHGHVRRHRPGPRAGRDVLRRLRRQRRDGRLLPIGGRAGSGSRSSSTGAMAPPSASASSRARWTGRRLDDGHQGGAPPRRPAQADPRRTRGRASSSTASCEP